MGPPRVSLVHVCAWKACVVGLNGREKGQAPNRSLGGPRSPKEFIEFRSMNAVAAMGGMFAQRGHSAGTAPIITMIIQVTTLKTTHLRNHAQSIQNSKIQTSDACHGSQGPKFCPL